MSTRKITEIRQPTEIINYCGNNVECWGELKWDSNISVVCEDMDGEVWETVWTDGASNWTEAVEKISNVMVDSVVIELRAV
jgi:hypothetical protein